MKRCSRCKVTKDIAEFHKDRSRPSGLQIRCKSCHLATNREWGERHPEVRAKNEALRPKKDRNVTGEARLAHRAVEAALARGSLVRPTSCSACDRTLQRIHAHHDDYSKPLDVRWLCQRCHARHHASIRETAA